MDSSLSSVPPVCPSPRPDIIGTSAPQAAASGASISDVLSPTPPVLCLSTGDAGDVRDSRTRTPERTIASVSAAVSSARHAAQDDRHQQGGRLVVGQRLPSVTPATKYSICARSSAPPSRLCRMRSTARMQGS